MQQPHTLLRDVGIPGSELVTGLHVGWDGGKDSFEASCMYHNAVPISITNTAVLLALRESLRGLGVLKHF